MAANGKPTPEFRALPGGYELREYDGELPLGEKRSQRMPTLIGSLAVFDARRELRYGLNFYRNQPIPSYNDDEIPSSPHLLIAKVGSLPKLSFLLRGRQLVLLGGFPAQNLQYFAISSVGVNRKALPSLAVPSKVPAP